MTGLYLSQLSVSRMAQKAMALFQMKGDRRDLSIKCHVGSCWTGFWTGESDRKDNIGTVGNLLL